VRQTQTKTVTSPTLQPTRPDLDDFPEREQALLREQLEGYRAYRDSRRNTAVGSADALAVILDFLRHAGGIPGQVTPSDFERWSAHLFRERGIVASTKRKYQASVRVFFDYLLREPRYRNRIRQALGNDIIQVATPENCIPHRQQRELDKDRRAFTQDEIEQLFGVIEQQIGFAYHAGSKSLRAHQRDKAALWLIYKLGLRADELLSLNLGSFEPNPDFPEFGANGYARVLGKGHKWRTVTTLDVSVALILEWYVNQVRPLYLDKAAPGEQALFLSERGHRLSYAALYRQYRFYKDLCGLAIELVPHCLRHSSVSHNDTQGLSLEANRLQHGHTYSATTQTYMHHPDQFVSQEFSRIIQKNLRKES
jgi:site-specific recombinase XerD